MEAGLPGIAWRAAPRGRLRLDTVTHPMAEIRETIARKPMIVVGTAAWTAPWLTEQNLAFSLAKSHPMLYVEPPEIPLRRAADGTPRLRRERRDGREIIIFRPLVLPLRSRAPSARVSAPLYRAQLGALTRRLGFEGAVILSGDARPGFLGAAGECLSSYIVKDWIYEDVDLLGRSAGDLLAERDSVCSLVDIVLAISPRLQTSLAAAGIPAQLLRHGFHADLTDEYLHGPPAEYAGLPTPRIVFAGRVDARLDIDRLWSLAQRLEGGSIVLIGPISPRMPSDDLHALRDEPNIHLLGARERARLPPYLSHADCLLIPYRDTVWAEHGSPLKLWDYLYAGAPIVGSGYTVLRDFEPLVRYVAGDGGEFADAVLAAVADPSGAQKRRALALRNTWDARAHELEGIFDRVLAERWAAGSVVS
jgi:glycosyltransferase involved in cell wall biosynthesis